MSPEINKTADEHTRREMVLILNKTRDFIPRISETGERSESDDKDADL